VLVGEARSSHGSSTARGDAFAQSEREEKASARSGRNDRFGWNDRGMRAVTREEEGAVVTVFVAGARLSHGSSTAQADAFTGSECETKGVGLLRSE